MNRFPALLLAVVLALAGCGAPPTAEPTGPYLLLTVSLDTAGLHYPPSWAVWVKDAGGQTATLFATKKAAAWATGTNNRPSALPVWNGVSGGSGDIDTVTQPTPKADALLALPLPAGFSGKLEVFVEINASFDYNEFYRQDAGQGKAGYSDVNGQPSLVYRAEVNTAAAAGPVALEAVGHGDVLGADHAVHADMDNITTAAHIVKSLTAEYRG